MGPDVWQFAFRTMEASETVRCPFCGQDFELVIDTSIASQRFTTDCDVCCRPFEVVAECEPGKILGLEVAGN
ncbi:MAG: CPXCG motif-containing cysteine-rich protein [Verrucomicrobia bacterium]|nr:MAG: CPXCG motif-containing cysteine-rich protein [Verrucomicrobiota bacterium]